MKQKITILILLLSSLSFCFGNETKASTGWDIFTKIQSTRSKSLSSTYLLPGDISGIIYNPSLLPFIKGRELDLISSSGYFDESVFGVLYSYKWKYDIDMAFSVFNYDYGKMDLCWIENDQILERTVSAQNDYLLALTGGRKLTDKLTAGLNFKVASSKIAEEASANAIALDTALTYKANEKYSAVFAAQNIGYGTQFIEKSEKLPTTLMVGLNYLRGIKSNYLMIGVYLPYVLEESRYTPEFGVELGRWPVSAYIGYKSNVDESTISYGFGL